METEYDYLNFSEYGSADDDYPRLTPRNIYETVTYVLPSVAALAGDIIVLTLVAKNRHLRSITNVYILQRVLSDLFAVCLFPVGVSLRLGYLEWEDSIGFNVILGIDYATLFTSSLFLILISMDCYLATRPRQNSLEKRWKVVQISSVVVWSAGLLYMAALTFSLPSVIEKFLRLRDQRVYNDFQPVFSIYFTFVVPIVICWVYVSFIFTVKSESVEASVGESVEVKAPPRSLVLALVTTHTAFRLPHHIWEHLYFVFSGSSTYVVVRFMLYLNSPVACFLYLFLQKDLRQALIKSFQSRSTSNIPLENL